MLVSVTSKIINEKQLKKIISNCNEDMKRAVELAFYNGLPIRKIESEMKLKRRYLQYRLKVDSTKALGFEVTFSQLRTSCIIYLFNQGYTPEYVTKILGYTRQDEVRHQRRLNGYVRPKLRFKVLERDGCKCVYCGAERYLEIDHIIPLSKGGKTNLNNLQTLCMKCNKGKGIKEDIKNNGN